MKIIQHRVNDYKQEKLASYAEIDVWWNNGAPVCCHEQEDIKVYPSHIHAAKKFKGYFVNVKQSMLPSQLDSIARSLGGYDNVVGFFDVPWPLALESYNYGIPIYFRMSEYEDPTIFKCDRIWFDPLDNQETHSYNLLYKVSHGEKVIIASPELHGHGQHHAENIWRHLKREFVHEIEVGMIEGIVTKWPGEAEKVFNA